jgi:predicted  nucleic acid-binding Zn-ribbon protein
MKYPQTKCEECGELFPQNRTDKQFCSGRCKSKNFRRVQKEKMNLLERLFDKLPKAADTVKHDLFA